MFMNSTIINEQRNGKQPDDLMAGLCRSIIENVYKVVRIANVAVHGGSGSGQGAPSGTSPSCGPGGVSGPGRDPGPLSRRDGRSGCGSRGEAGGGGPRLRQRCCSAFIGFDAVKNFQYTRESGVLCPTAPTTAAGRSCISRTVAAMSPATGATGAPS
ncbi:MAG: hypothetical protein ACLTYN_02955 [Dysosmobacter welbionis]